MTCCPVCNSISTAMYLKTPYHMCPNCGLWFQHPLPEKVYEAPHEKNSDGSSKGAARMDDQAKKINKQIANSIFSKYLGHKPAKILDIGSKFPYLAHCFQQLGCKAFGMDYINETENFGKALGVSMLYADFEEITTEQVSEWTKTEKFDLITMVHLFEHMYNPIKALKKAKSLLTDNGLLYLRLPDHEISGFEEHLSPGHFSIHPYFHSLSSILEILVHNLQLRKDEVYHLRL